MSPLSQSIVLGPSEVSNSSVTRRAGDLKARLRRQVAICICLIGTNSGALAPKAQADMVGLTSMPRAQDLLFGSDSDACAVDRRVKSK
jgi:hypothetical protein